MKEIETILERVIHRININLRRFGVDWGPLVRGLYSPEQFRRFYALYALTSHHPFHFRFRNSCLSGSYFLGRCHVDQSILYKSDVRGDELKEMGDLLEYDNVTVPVFTPELIRIRNSYLIHSLVHSHSHDPERPDRFMISNSISLHYANIHGSPLEGCFLAPFSTVDCTPMHDCIVGAYAYIQTERLSHSRVEDGEVRMHAKGAYDFHYRFPREILDPYLHVETGKRPEGRLMEFIDRHKEHFQALFDAVPSSSSNGVSPGASLSPFALILGKCHIGKNVLVAQRAFVDTSWLGKGTNVQENCYVLHSRLEGYNVTAHGGKLCHAELGEKVFVGFNAFLRGSPEHPIRIGKGSIVMPHTIVDAEEPLEIPPGHLLWGFVANARDLEENSISLEELEAVEGRLEKGGLRFEGKGSRFVRGFQGRIEHTLLANGAYFDGVRNQGHAQKAHDIHFYTLQPYPEGPKEGLYPTIEIQA